MVCIIPFFGNSNQTKDRKRQDMIRLAEEGTQVSQSEMDQISEKLRQVALERSEKATRQKVSHLRFIPIRVRK